MAKLTRTDWFMLCLWLMFGLLAGVGSLAIHQIFAAAMLDYTPTMPW